MAEETRDERAQRLLCLGMQVAARIREEPADAVARLINHLGRTELRDMVMVLAAAVPDDRPISTLIDWWEKTITARRRILLGADEDAQELEASR